MVIYEIEYEEGHSENYHDRYIVAPSFEAYKKCLFGEVKHAPDIGFFGRHQSYTIIEDDDNYLKIRFNFPKANLIQCDFIHLAKPVNARIDVLEIFEK